MIRHKLFRRARNNIQAGIDLTPMVDTVFNLLIFFMLTSSFVLQSGIDVELPQAAAVQRPDQKDLTVTITKDRDILINKQSVSRAELSRALQRAIKELDVKEPNLLIVPDARVDVGLLVEVMDAARGAGVQKYSIATQPPDERR